MKHYEFKTWDLAKKFFMTEILPTIPNEDELKADDLFTIWAEDNEIVIKEAEELAESDMYDLNNHNLK